MSNTISIAKKLDEISLSVTKSLEGFERAFNIATAIQSLSEMLTPEYMKPIMALQGNRLGFLTDKDKQGGYHVDVVKKCLIEAVLSGLQPAGNHFNIIAGNMYPTKEGCGYRLNNIKGLSYDLVCSLPRIQGNSAAVDVTIEWTLNGDTKKKVVPIPIKIDNYTSVDAIIGKATRKGRAWLISAVTGVEITDGEVQDIEGTVMESTVSSSPEIKSEVEILVSRAVKLINSTSTINSLNAVLNTVDPEILKFPEVEKSISERKKIFEGVNK